MEKDINDEIKELFENTHSIVDNDMLLKYKLGISDDVYKVLKKTENLKTFCENALGAGMAGTIAGGSVALALTSSSSLGLIGTVGYALGLVSIPVWPIAAAGAGVAGMAFLGLKAYRKLTAGMKAKDDKLVVKIPKFIKSPLDIIAMATARLLLLPSLKVAQVDGDVPMESMARILNNLSKHWGFNEAFLNDFIHQLDDDVAKFSYSEFAKELKTVCEKYEELNYEKITTELLTLIKEIIELDGVVTKSEMTAYNSLEYFLTC